MSVQLSKRPLGLRLLLVGGLLFLGAACAKGPELEAPGYQPELVTRAIHEADVLRASGHRVWCVPFARNASGIQIRGDAWTWWTQAKDQFFRTKQPVEGAVMSFSSTKSLPLGHVAVVSDVISEREIKISHANWHRSQVSLDMPVIDVSEANDWSKVRVQSFPESFGKVYLVDGFIFDVPGAEDEAG